MTSCRKIITLLHIFQFTTYLEHFRSQNPNAWSINLIVSLIMTFYLTKTEGRTKKSLMRPSYYCFEETYYFLNKNAYFLEKYC